MPAWATDLIRVLAHAIAGLISAEDEEARLEVAMRAAEDLKAALDRARWPNG